ncbi:DNRLRE domain-containing protein [candidate division KSB1 bacterium]|nr:DNRLRE domain-containing protein [candidate division KSB1 bacterium]RQW05425.1 MAG: DNRLRE domain-containing protein [candidate division KSB1 bacterium]
MKKILALVVMILSLTRCTNDRSIPNGYELFERDNKDGLAQPITLLPLRVGCYWSLQPAGDKTNLLLGSGNSSQSFVIFGCENLAKADSGAELVSAKLALRSSFHMGEATPFTVTAHRVAAEWAESSVLWQDVKDSYQADPVETFEFTPRDTTWHIIPMTNLAFMKEWISDAHQSSQDIHGLLLKFERASGGSILASSEATLYPPYFEIVTRADDSSLDTTTAKLSHDASLVLNGTNVPPETLENDPATLRIGNGSGYRSLLLFDLAQIPREATIHQALLTFKTDRAEIYVPDASVGVTFSVAARALVDSSWTPTSIAIDSSASAAVDVASGTDDSFAFDSASPVQSVSQIVQRWVSEIAPNYGLMIYPYYQNSDFQEMAFMSGVADANSAPTLVITYSLPPAHRFAQP